QHMAGDDAPRGLDVGWRDAQNLASVATNLFQIGSQDAANCDRVPLETWGIFVHFRCARAGLRIMATSEPRRIGVSIELKPHAYDPAANPELFEGVVARRVVAFLIDFVILAVPVVFLSMFIFVVGIVTFGLGFVFYALLWPAMVIWAVA